MNNQNPYHAHVYFTEDTKEIARNVVTSLTDEFSIEFGRFWDHSVGPHPVGSCQITVPVEKLGPALNWLALNRQGLTIFIHADTGDVMKDHTEHTIWMGAMPELRLEVLEKIVAQQEAK